jgi:DNA-binding NtrC family response regulator
MVDGSSSSLVCVHDGQYQGLFSTFHGSPRFRASMPGMGLHLQAVGGRSGSIQVGWRNGEATLFCEGGVRLLGTQAAQARDVKARADLALMLGRQPVMVASRHTLFPGDEGGRAFEWLEWAGMIGADPMTWEMWANLVRAADGGAPVWISGESGTGKEMAAKAIHDYSPRHQGPFVALNCAAIHENLVEAELFGVIKGAFTGADRDRPGAFQRADGGTLFLDEVGELSPSTQAKLLRVLESGEVNRIGGFRTERVNVRVVAATWRDLEREVDAGRFRHDLLHRLWVLKVELPPLRHRQHDIPVLIAARLRARGALHLLPSGGLQKRLSEDRWTGNVRQLFNQVERAIAHDDPEQLLPIKAGEPPPARLPRRSAVPICREHEHAQREARSQIRRQLQRFRDNRTHTARALGVSRSTLYRWLRTEQVF